jgi:hypothetical protein
MTPHVFKSGLIAATNIRLSRHAVVADDNNTEEDQEEEEEEDREKMEEEVTKP